MPSPWLNSDPSGEISVSNMDRLMMDYFSLLFQAYLLENKNTIKQEILLVKFLLIVFTLILS